MQCVCSAFVSTVDHLIGRATVRFACRPQNQIVTIENPCQLTCASFCGTMQLRSVAAIDQTLISELLNGTAADATKSSEAEFG